MECDDLALDGLLRELSRAEAGDDEAFVRRVLDRARPRRSILPALAAVALFATGVFFAAPWEPPTGRIAYDRGFFPEAASMRISSRDRATGRMRLLGDLPFGRPARVPADVPLLVQAVAPDGMALWTAPWVELRPREVRGAASGPVVDLSTPVRCLDYARDVKPILDLHCSGCHAEGDVVRGPRVRPFEARRSALVIQTHAPVSGADRQVLALWVDLGAPGRP